MFFSTFLSALRIIKNMEEITFRVCGLFLLGCAFLIAFTCKKIGQYLSHPSGAGGSVKLCGGEMRHGGRINMRSATRRVVTVSWTNRDRPEWHFRKL